MFHNLNHELIFPLESVCLGIASFSYSSAWAFYYQRIDMGELQKKKILYSKFGSLDDIFSVKDVDSFRLHHVLVVCRNCQRIILMFQT